MSVTPNNRASQGKPATHPGEMPAQVHRGEAAIAGHRTRTTMSTRSVSTKTTPTTTMEWLPLKSSQTAKARVLRLSNIESRKDEDWFLAFATEMDPTDHIQSKMVAKIYLFLRDFIPEGLTGPYAHIRGNDIMDQLLCHKKESTYSRHTVSTYANKVLIDLGHWQGTAKNWQEALRRGKAEADAEKYSTAKKKMAGRAPGLHSPAALMAVLIIAYPDPNSKVRNWIGRMQIGWMMTQPRDTLKVTSGFWKGVHAGNINTVFAPETDEERKAAVTVLADYDSIFGQDFTNCIKDIRPYLPEPWASNVGPLTGAIPDAEEEPDLGLEDIEEATSGLSDPQSNEHDGVIAGDEDGVIAGDDDVITTPDSVVTNDDDAASDGPVNDDIESDDDGADSTGPAFEMIDPSEVAHLRELLNARGPRPEDLQQWLVEQLGFSGPGESHSEVLEAWCRFWEERIDKVNNYQEQEIVRSLFAQSLNRVRNLHQDSHPLTDAFMLSDMSGTQVRISKKDVQGPGPRYQNLQPLKAFVEASKELLDLINDVYWDSRSKSLVKNFFAERALTLCEFTSSSPFCQRWVDLFRIEILYIHIVMKRQDPVMPQAEMDDWLAKRTMLIDTDAMSPVQLHQWQLLALLYPGSLSVLTDWQDYTFKCICLRHAAVESELGVKPTPSSTLLPKAVRQRHQSLYKLFDTERPPEIPRPLSMPPSRASSRSPSKAPSVAPSVASRNAASKPPSRPSSVAPGGVPTRVPTKAPSMPSSKTPSRPSHDMPGSPTLGTTPGTVNPFVGLSYTPAKRAADGLPAGTRSQKMPRLTPIVMREDLDQGLEDVKSELSSAIDGLETRVAATCKSEFSSATVGLREDIATALKSDASSSTAGLREDMVKVRSHLAKLEARLDGMMSVEGQIQSALGSMQDVLQQQKHDIVSQVQQQKGKVIAEIQAASTTAKAEIMSKVDLAARTWGVINETAMHQALSAHHEALLLALIKPKEEPKPGQDGYLSRYPAPDGWAQDKYESVLLRAAWLYINTLGNPDDGVSADERAMSAVISVFPAAHHEHIIGALNHVHIQAYGCPFRLTED